MDFLTAAERLGVPVAVMLVMGLAIRSALMWAAKYVVGPLVAKHISFIDKIVGELENQTKMLSANTGILRKVAENTQSLHEIKMAATEARAVLATAASTARDLMGKDAGEARDLMGKDAGEARDLIARERKS